MAWLIWWSLLFAFLEVASLYVSDWIFYNHLFSGNMPQQVPVSTHFTSTVGGFVVREDTKKKSKLFNLLEGCAIYFYKWLSIILTFKYNKYI